MAEIVNNFTIPNINVKYFEGIDSIKKFTSFLRKYEPLSKDEEIQYFKMYKEDGNVVAREKLFLHNQRFVYSFAKIYARDSDEVLDYVNEGNIGLNEAIEKFDYKKYDNKFMTFAARYIRREMWRFINETRDPIKQSNSQKYKKKIRKIKQDYFNKYGLDPTIEDVKEILEEEYHVEVKDISDLYDLDVESINSNINDDTTLEESDLYCEKTSSYNDYESKSDNDYIKAIVRSLLKLLPKTQQDIIKKIYGIDYERAYTLSEVAYEYGMEESELVKLEDKILDYMKQNAKEMKAA